MKRFLITLVCSSTSLFFLYCNDQASSSDTTTDATASSNVADDWKLGTQLWTFRMFTLAEALNKADSAGVKNVEAYWGQPLGAGSNDSFGIRMSDDSKAMLKSLLQDKGMHIVAMGVISPRTNEAWQQAFELAKEFGLSYITTEPRKDMWDLIDSLSGVYGIKIAIHEHGRPNPYWHPDSVLAAMAGHPNIGACADLGHWGRSGLDPVECLKMLEGHVYGVHLKDIVTFNDLHAADTPVSKGVLNYPAIFAELKRQQFKGMLSIEQESNWYNSVPDVTATVQYYKSQVEKLK